MPPLRDLTEGPRPLPVSVTWSPVYEVLAALWTLSDKDHAADDDAARAFYDEHIAAMAADVRPAFESVSVGGGVVWLSLFTPAADLGDDLSPSSFIDAICALPDTGVRRLIVDTMHDVDATLADAVVDGDAGAIADLIAAMKAKKPSSKHAWIDGVGELLSTSPGTLRDNATTVLEAGFDTLFTEHIETYSSALQRDASATTELSGTMNPAALIEHATNGIAYTPQPGENGFLLIPSAVVRPWTLMIEDRGTRVFVYSVGDEFLTFDPDIPPAWLVAAFKALSDDRRLRVLRRLAAEPASLGQLADHIGVAKSTMHHHVGILRRAGLVRVSVGGVTDGGKYSLRPEVLPEIDRMLGGYLETPTTNNKE